MKKLIYDIKAKKSIFGAGVISLVLLAMLTSTIILLPDKTVHAASTGDFDNYQILTIDHTQVPSDLTNFPVLVYNSSWVTGLNATSFTFFQPDNSTECNWELEKYDSNTGELVAWVNISSISSTTDTTFYLYYDSSNSTDGGENNPEGTWDSNYIAVYHGRTLEDSTSNNYDLTNNGTTLDATGIVSGCFDFESSESDYVYDNTFYDLSTLSVVTIEAYFNIESVSDTSPNYYAGIKLGQQDDTGNSGLTLRYRTLSDPHFQVWSYTPKSTNDNGLECTTSYTTGTWYYVAGVVIDSSDSTKIYVNGTQESGDTISGAIILSNIGTDTLEIGRQKTTTFYDGKLDEVRISKVERSADWINTCYNNINNKSTFITFGGSSGTPAGSYSLSISGSDMYFSWHGQPGDIIWANDTSDGTEAETGYIYTNLSGTSNNCTDVYLDFSNFSSDIYYQNLSIEVSSDGTWSGNTHQITDANGNVTLNSSVWSSSSWCNGNNPFPIDGANSTIQFRLKLAIPSGATSGTKTASDWKCVWRVLS